VATNASRNSHGTTTNCVESFEPKRPEATDTAQVLPLAWF